MFSVVPSELVTARKSPRAPFPRAFIRLLPCVGPLVRLQVRTLCVNLGTPDVVALVYALACVVDGRAPHPQPVVRLSSREVSKWVRVNHTESWIVELRVGDISASDQHGQDIRGLHVLVDGAGSSAAATAALQAVL